MPQRPISRPSPNEPRAPFGGFKHSEWFIEDELKSGALVPVLAPWCPSIGGLRLYYSGHRFVPARLRELISLVHELGLGGAPLRPE